jgi:hypothetical protein
MLSPYTKLIVYFIMRLMGRLIGRMPFAPTQTKMRLIGRMPFAPTEEIQPAQAGFVCVDAVSTAWSSLSAYLCLSAFICGKKNRIYPHRKNQVIFHPTKDYNKEL